ncbi:hypothetical protein M758_UG045500 [Ceratodon purpureus]|nr:hypothetical protein M758_UG045500 [Ceratodon purpureus]
MKGGGITGGAGASSVTPFMLQNLTKSLSESAERGERGVRSGRRGKEAGVLEREREREREWRERGEREERERERVRVQQARSEAERERRDGVVVCKERAGGVQWKYVSKDGRVGEKAMQVMHAKQHRDPVAELVTFVKSYIVPEGYPESVAPSYTPYMQWRAVQYFFGGAMSVFTTRSLLHALGVSRGHSASSSVAINWAIKDGAGRIGKMIFARHGKKFDVDLKQLRFKGAMLMQLGAGVELATMVVPHFFLPLACAANVAKNVAAVTSSSTRAPIYKAFARRENIGDVTAKGECISNIADLMGTGLGIFISKKNPSLIATFCVLSCGYMISSFNEVKSVRLATLNRARFGVVVQSFLETGQIPSVEDANRRESVLTLPWQEKPLELGSRVAQAFSNPREFLNTQEQFQKENYLVTYRPNKRRAYVVIKESATSDDVVRATFQAHVMLHMLRELEGTLSSSNIEAAVAESSKCTHALYDDFKQLANSKVC